MFCKTPFDCLEVLHQHYTTCCSSWLDGHVQVFDRLDDPWLIWNHRHFQVLRQALLDGDYSYCQRCPVYLSGQAGDSLAHATSFPGTLTDSAPPGYTPVMRRGPAVLNLGNDPSCNLYCWSCRKEPKIADDTEFRQRLISNLVEQFLPDCRLLSLSHAGDPFASRIFRNFLRELDGRPYPQLKIRLFTNGLLLPWYWDSLEKIHGNISAIWISVDAATEGTYEKLRRGARWKKLLNALSCVAKLKQAGIIEEFQLNFCVQAANYREMPDFVRLARAYNVTRVSFAALLPWWQDDKELGKSDVCRSDHPEHASFMRILNDPQLDSPLVCLDEVTGRLSRQT